MIHQRQQVAGSVVVSAPFVLLPVVAVGQAAVVGESIASATLRAATIQLQLQKF